MEILSDTWTQLVPPPFLQFALVSSENEDGQFSWDSSLKQLYLNYSFHMCSSYFIVGDCSIEKNPQDYSFWEREFEALLAGSTSLFLSTEPTWAFKDMAPTGFAGALLHHEKERFIKGNTNYALTICFI